LAKKKCRKRSFASAEATNAPRVGSAPPFEKGGRKLPRRHRREVTDKSKFEPKTAPASAGAAVKKEFSIT
jgi:hypothetical protein